MGGPNSLFPYWSIMSTQKTGKGLREAIREQVRRGDLLAAECPSRAVLSHVTSRWGVLILVILLGGTHRFSQLRREVGGVSEKMLAQTLDALAGDGFVLRRDYGEIPPRVDYSLTPMGREVAERLEVLVDWIESNFPRIEAARQELAKAA
jgi:DNA-binding HxlR family transcriptional regulator